MTLILNYLPHLIFLLFVGFAWAAHRNKHYKTAQLYVLAGVVIAFVGNILLSAGGPKGTVPESTVPRFERLDVPVQDRLRAPKPEDEARKTLESKLDWKERVREER